jgi:phage-related protein
MNGIKNTISSIWNGIKNVVSSVVNGIRNTVSSVFNGIKSVATSVWNGIKTAITRPIEKARDTIKGIVDKIKGFFTGMKLEFPNIKLPHFSISPSGWKIGDLLEGSIPKLSIQWYAKAMNDPMIMNSPTLFGYNPATGSLMGGGEAGSEVVSGTNTLMNMIGSAVESKTNVQTERIIAVLTAVLNAIVDGNDDLLKAVLAGQTIVLDNREIGRTVRKYA